MNDVVSRPEINIFAGRFGSGKTETALNYAVALAHNAAPGIGGYESQFGRDGEKVILIDLDIITPYFRSRETASQMEQRGVKVVAPAIAGQHLHLPAITPQILGAIEQRQQPVVLDVGGDKQGARALGQFSAAIQRRGYAMYFVVNPYRPFTSTLAGLTSSIGEIESSSRLRVSGLVSNPNLMGETTATGILNGHALIEEFARDLGLPIAFVCIEQGWAARLDLARFSQPALVLERYFVQPWDRT